MVEVTGGDAERELASRLPKGQSSGGNITASSGNRDRYNWASGVGWLLKGKTSISINTTMDVCIAISLRVHYL